jgi:hypothetical protein
MINLRRSNGMQLDASDHEQDTSCSKPEELNTLIVQRYIDRPLLINKRKFDIRVYAMLVCNNGITRGYFYEEGYIRTSSKEYSTSINKLKNKFVHLTNDAIQKTSSDYGRFETGNKLTFKDF